MSSPSIPVCPSLDAQSCCDGSMEQNIYAVSERQLSVAMTKWLETISQQMENDCVSLDYYFRSDLKEARERLHNSFSTIYGLMYQRNRDFFYRLFADLDDYMAGKRGQLKNLLDDFFAQLRTSIVGLIETSALGGGVSGSGGSGGAAAAAAAAGSATGPRSQDSKRIQCLSNALNKQKPFDDVDTRLQSRFLEAYPPARMLVNSLAAGSELVRSILREVSGRPECIVAFARLHHCGTYCLAREPPPHASASPTRDPDLCAGACSTFASVCFSEGKTSRMPQLADVWTQLIDSISQATTRLERSFNFPGVNKNLHIYLSEAITYVQQKYSLVKTQIGRECDSAGTGILQRGFPPAGAWPYDGTGGRVRRNLNDSEVPLLRVRRQQMRPPYSADSNPPPEFYNWQQAGRQRPQYLNSPPARPLSSSYNEGRQPMNDGVTAVDNRDSFIQWAGQLKSFYSNLRDIFKAPPNELCPRTSVPSTNCWNPPPLEGGRMGGEFQQTVNKIGEVARNLHAATLNNGDPDVLDLGSRVLTDLISKKNNNSASLASSFFGSPRRQQPQISPPTMYQPPTVNQRPPMAQPSNQWSGTQAALGPYNNDPYRPRETQPGRFPDQIEYSGAQPGGVSGMEYGRPPAPPQPPQQPPQQPYPPLFPGSPSGSSVHQPPPGPPATQWEYSGVAPPQYGGSNEQQPSPHQPQPPLPPPWPNQWQPGGTGSPDVNQPSWQQPPVNQWQQPPHPAYPQPNPQPPSQFGGGSYESSGDYGPALPPESYPQPEAGPPPARPDAPPAELPTSKTTSSPNLPITTTTTTSSSPTTTTVVTAVSEHLPAPAPREEINTTTLLSNATLTTAIPPIPPPSRPEVPSYQLPEGGLEPQRPVDGLPDDEDFVPSPQPLPPPPDQKPDQSPTGPSEPRPPPWAAQLPDTPTSPDGGSGLPPLPPDMEKPPPTPSGTPDRDTPPPDCSADGAAAGSGMDPRCFAAGVTPSPAEVWPPVMPPAAVGEGSGDYLQPPPPPFPEEPDDGSRRPDFGPDLNVDERVRDRKPIAHPPPIEQPLGPQPDPSATVRPAVPEPPIVVPPGVWVPGKGKQPGQLPESRLFRPVYERDRGTTVPSRTTSGANAVQWYSVTMGLLLMIISTRRLIVSTFP